MDPENNGVNEQQSNANDVNNNNQSPESNQNNDKQNEKSESIPYSRFKEVNDKKKLLEDKIKDLELTINNNKTEKETSEKNIEDRIKELEKANSDRVKEIKDKYETSIIENAGVEDTKYLKFLTNEKINSEENLSFEDAIAKVKEENPNMFIENKKKSPGKKPQSNNTGKIPYSEWEAIKDRKERTKLMNEGKVDLNS